MFLLPETHECGHILGKVCLTRQNKYSDHKKVYHLIPVYIFSNIYQEDNKYNSNYVLVSPPSLPHKSALHFTISGDILATSWPDTKTYVTIKIANILPIFYTNGPICLKMADIGVHIHYRDKCVTTLSRSLSKLIWTFPS